jgi:hypothetical protein
MLSGSIMAHFAISIAFSGEPPMPSESNPGGHQSAPMVGTMESTQSTTESDGSSIANFDLFSEPPPLAATITSTLSPGTSSTCVTAGVLSPVLFRLPSGSASIEARSGLSLSVYARRTPSFTSSASDSFVSQRTSMPTRMKAIAMPVSWQIGRWPSAAMRELMRICAIASLAAGDSSRW